MACYSHSTISVAPKNREFGGRYNVQHSLTKMSGNARQRRSRKRFDNIPSLAGTRVIRLRRGPSGANSQNALAAGADACKRQSALSTSDSNLDTGNCGSGRGSLGNANDCFVTVTAGWEAEEEWNPILANAPIGDSCIEFELSGGDESPDCNSSEVEHAESGMDMDVGIERASSMDAVRSEGIVQCLITDWRLVWALVMTSGSRKLTKHQYQSIRTYTEANLSAISGSRCAMSRLPHYTTLQNVLKPKILKLLGPRSEDHFVNVDMSKAGAKHRRLCTDGLPQAAVRIVLPSEYARADVATPEVFSAICRTSLSTSAMQNGLNDSSLSSSECIDCVPLISAREWFYGSPQSVNVDQTQCNCPYSTFGEAGDTIRISVLSFSSLEERIARCFGICESMNTDLTGVIECIWTVHHRKRRALPDFVEELPPQVSGRDKRIASTLNFVVYTSPSDSVSVAVPEIPEEFELTENGFGGGESMKKKPRMSPEWSEAVRERRRAQKQKTVEEERAWSKWKKPSIKPGDIFALIRPKINEKEASSRLLTSIDKQSRLCVVFRFWAEREERSRHLLWISGGTDIPDISDISCDAVAESTTDFLSFECIFSSLTEEGETYLDVRSITLEAVHGRERGPLKYRPTSSIGELSTSEPYCVYRFLLYWDGFEVQAGKTATGEGIYLLCLNLPIEARSSPSAVRIISLTPPGVKSAAIMEIVLKDVMVGMTSGFKDYDSNGTPRRIFLDLVGVIGDTPALNAALDVLGHTGSACCHMCRIVRGSTTMIGSQYTNQTSHGFVTAFRRSFYQHTAVRDCSAQEETCRILGMKPNPTAEQLVLHRWRTKIRALKGKIPITSTGDFVVPCSWDPYSACFVAPDHLLSAHFRDCINLAFRLLPSAEVRAACEQFMLSMLDSCALPKQNRLLDHQKKSLYCMSMTELYSLVPVAELAFVQGCASAANVFPAFAEIPQKSLEAIELVRSALRLIATIWYIPRAGTDGISEAQIRETKFRLEQVRRIQDMAKAHIDRIENICRFTDSDFDAMEDMEKPARLRNALARKRQACIIAIKSIDKPNVHRIVELVHSTLPMFGHASFFGELVLEKRHQTLKRAVKNSNNKDSHLQAMSAAIFNDWQGRISISAPLVSSNDSAAILSCFRLFASREAVVRVQGKLQTSHKAQVLQTVGLESCLLKELRAQAVSVLSRRYNRNECEKWELKSQVEQESPGHDISTQYRVDTLTHFKRAYPLTWSSFKVFISDAISSTIGSGIPGRVFSRGDIIQILTHYPKSPVCHYPFVAQAARERAGAVAEIDTGYSLWCVHSIIASQKPQTERKFLLALIPCAEKPNERQTPKLFQVVSGAPVCFAELDDSVRFVPVVHDCATAMCKTSPRHPFVNHENPFSPFDGTPFIPITRKMGYPPRMG